MILAVAIVLALASQSPSPAADAPPTPTTPTTPTPTTPTPTTPTTPTTPPTTPTTPPTATPTTTQGPRILRLAVTDVKASDVAPAVARVVGASVTAELRKLDGVAVVGVDEVRDSLDHEAQRELTGCADDHCLADIVGALGVDEIVVATVAHVGKESIFGLRRIALSGAATRGQVDQRLTMSDGEEFLAAVGPAVKAAFPEHALKTGKVRGVSDELALRLHPPPLPTVVFYSGIVAAGVAAVGGGVTTAYWVYNAEQFNQASRDGADVQARAGQELTARILMIGMWAATGVVAVATGVAVPFTDWNHLQDGVALDAQR